MNGMKYCQILAISIIGLLLQAPVAHAGDGMFKPVADLRLGWYGRSRDDRDGSKDSTDTLRLRLRLGVAADFSDTLSARVRLAGRYYLGKPTHFHSEFFENIPPGSDGLGPGDSTIDELYVRYQPTEQWDIKLGRMQTKFELEGVAKKSLSRNDSPSTDITWTDGIHVRYHNWGWDSHLIVQRSVDEGPTTVRHAPLYFTENASHLTYYVGMEKKDKAATVRQAGWDITYIPEALHKDGVGTTLPNRIEDYYGVSGRLALAWPTGWRDMTFLWGGEAAFAPNTPTQAAAKLAGGGDTSGLAFETSANLLNILPDHSFGVVYMQARGGWLLSPDIKPNQQSVEGRYKWQITKKQKFEMRLRRRGDFFMQTGNPHRRWDLDYYLRYTIKL